MNRIGIYGIGGLHNFGCEAIVRGTVNIIRHISCEEPQITYYSYNYQYDKSVIKDLGIEIESIESKSSFFRRVISKLIDVFRIPYVPFCRTTFNKIIAKSDVVFSVGGDLYTIPKYLREKKKYRYQNRIVAFGEKAIEENRRMVVFGASIGPFGNYKRAVDYYRNHLMKTDLIVAREEKCIDYLNSINVSSNTCFFPDPAFFVSIESEELEKKYIGINLSPYSIVELYGNIDEAVICKMATLIERIYSENKIDILLIPHVVSNSIEDDDKRFLEKIYNHISEKCKTHVQISKANSFLAVKKELRNCRIVASARMHCAINATVEGVPTLFLSYSDKAEGMARYIYGSDKWVIPVENMESSLVQKLSELIDEEKQVSEFLVDRLKEIKNNLLTGDSIDRLKEVINS